jgi:tRNA nucleotidyltransferase (CCA-adding enzyme)
VARAQALSQRLRAPLECRDAARLAVRWHRAIAAAETLTPAALLDLLLAADALRRAERLDTLAAAAAAHIAAHRTPQTNGRRRTALLHEALAVVRGVDAAAIARDAIARAAAGSRANSGDAIAAALRDARLAALRDWKAARKRAGG